MFNFGGPVLGQQPSLASEGSSASEDEYYKVPEARANGRPHELGWLDILKEDGENDEKMKLGKIPPGKIISE